MAFPLALALGLGSQAIGGKQLGAPAPAFNPGQGGGLLGGGALGGDQSNPFSAFPGLIDLLSQREQSPVDEALAKIAPKPPTEIDPVLNGEVDAIDFGADTPADPSNFAKFFGGIDKTLQSPSKQLGLGLLGQIDPRLGGAGLLASGLLGTGIFGGK